MSPFIIVFATNISYQILSASSPMILSGMKKVRRYLSKSQSFIVIIKTKLSSVSYLSMKRLKTGKTFFSSEILLVMLIWLMDLTIKISLKSDSSITIPPKTGNSSKKFLT